jgi:AcrR family transcriptional regulator
MSLRARKKLATRTALIATARRLFAEKGYENTTLEEICEEVQIHVTTFFSYFESKEELAFARTLEMLDSFHRHMEERPDGSDVMTVWWKFLYDFGLRARGEEHAIMVRLENTPALRNRYANIVRQYEEGLARALALEAGVDPVKDLYSQLLAATLISTIVAGARWHTSNFGVDAEEADTAVFAKQILSRFPSRAEIEKEQKRIAKSAKPKQSAPGDSGEAPGKPAPARPRRKTEA